jgi:hypothetical protein
MGFGGIGRPLLPKASWLAAKPLMLCIYFRFRRHGWTLGRPSSE